MVHSMEDEFQEIVGVSFSLWIFVIAFMIFNVDGLHLYFWISFIPLIAMGMKLQHTIATLALENAGVCGQFVRPRDGLFWFNKPELLLSLIHFIFFQICWADLCLVKVKKNLCKLEVNIMHMYIYLVKVRRFSLCAI